MRLFVDTSALVALANTSDDYHSSAVAFREKIRSRKTPYKLLITTNYVFDETMTLLKAVMRHDFVVSFGQSLRDSNLFRIDWVTLEIEASAWEIFVKFRDKDFSYTDCTSFALMKSYQIKEAFAYDEHFDQFGYEQVP
jgi:uncharacterized protein